MNLLARCFEEGWGCAKSHAEAAHWYKRSAESGYFRAQFNYAVLLAEQGDSAAAAQWFWKAAASGDAGIRRTIRQVLAGVRDTALIEVRDKVAMGVEEE